MAIEAQRPSTFERICDYEGSLEFRVPVHRRALLAALALAALVSAAVAVAIQTGALADFYEWLWMNTTGKTDTDVMRDYTWGLPDGGRRRHRAGRVPSAEAVLGADRAARRDVLDRVRRRPRLLVTATTSRTAR